MPARIKVSLLLPALMCLTTAEGQYPVNIFEAPGLLEVAYAEVEAINGMDLRRYSGNIGDEWEQCFYFDDEGRLRRSTLFYSFPEGEGGYYRYYNADGIAICTTFRCASGHDGDISWLFFRDGEGAFLWLDYLEHNGDGVPVPLADIVWNGGHSMQGMTVPLTEMLDIEYACYRDVDELRERGLWPEHALERDWERVRSEPELFPLTRTVLPGIGDEAYVARNRMPVYEKPTISSKVTGNLRLSLPFIITGEWQGWFRVDYHIVESDESEGTRYTTVTGYIEKKYVLPVEQLVGER